MLSGQAIERIQNSPIKKMIISDSVDQSGRSLPDKFEIISCAELIGEAIRRIFEEESVSTLFDEKNQVPQA